MDQQLELESKRKEVKQEILALKEHVLLARILNQLGKAFKHNSLGYWLSNIVLLNLILLGPWLLIGLILQEVEKTLPLFVNFITAIELAVLCIIVAHIAAQILLDDVANRIVEKTSNVDDLSKMLLWFKTTLSTRHVSAFILAFCVFWTLLAVSGMSALLHQFVGFGLTLTIILTGFVVGLAFYVPWWIILIIVKLRDYQYEMNAFSPADSEVINDISEILMKCVYILAGVLAVTTFGATSNWISQQLRLIFSLPILAFGWIVITTQFLLTRSTLGAITNRAKWKTLNRIRDKINTLEATGDLSSKDTVESLFRLVDIHKQIMASKTNTLDLTSVSTLFSQLMLPLLGLLLGNLDNVLKLVSK